MGMAIREMEYLYLNNFELLERNDTRNILESSYNVKKRMYHSFYELVTY